MRRIALINQKGGVGKTTSTANLGAALAREGQRVVLIDLDPQANLSLHLDCQLDPDEPSTYGVLLGDQSFGEALRPTTTPNLSLVASSIDLSGAELELASALGRETLLRDAIDAWEESTAGSEDAGADFLLIDCPPSLGLLSINGLVAAREAIVTVQTEFFALQGMSKLVEVVQVLKKRLNPNLEVAGILPCLYDNRLRLAREVLAEIRNYFPGQVFAQAIGKNVKLAERRYGKTIFEYAPESSGAADYQRLAVEVLARGAAGAPAPAAAPQPAEGLARVEVVPTPPPPAKKTRKAAAPAATAPAADSASPSTNGAATDPAQETPPDSTAEGRETPAAADQEVDPELAPSPAKGPGA